MDSRIRQITHLHDSILNQIQQFKIGREHIEKINHLITKKDLTLDDITSTFETIKSEQKESVLSDQKNEKPLFTEAVAAAYDIALKLDEAIILRHFSESKHPETKVENNSSTERMGALIQQQETLYKQALQQEIAAKTKDRIESHNKTVDTLNQKIKQFKEDFGLDTKAKPEAKKGHSLSQLIEKEKRLAVLNYEIESLFAETFQLNDIKIAVESPTIDIEGAFPELRDPINSMQENIKRKEQQEKAYAKHQALLLEIKGDIEKYHALHVAIPYSLSNSVKSGLYAGYERTKAATQIVTYYIPSLSSQPTSKNEVKAKADPTTADYHLALLETLSSVKSIHKSAHISESEKLQTLEQEKLKKEDQLREEFKQHFSAEQLNALKAAMIEAEKMKIASLEGLPILSQVSEEEWKHVLENHSAEELEHILKGEQRALLQEASAHDQNSKEYAAIRTKYAIVIAKLNERIIQEKAKEQALPAEQHEYSREDSFDSKENNNEEHEPLLRRLSASRINAGEDKVAPNPQDDPKGRAPDSPEQEPLLRRVSAEEDAASLRPQPEHKREEASHFAEDHKEAPLPSSRMITSERHAEDKQPPSSNTGRNIAIVLGVTLFITGAVLTGGSLLGVLTASYFLYAGLGALGFDVFGGLTFGMKKLWNACCSSKKSKPKPENNHAQNNQGKGNKDIRNGLHVPATASGLSSRSSAREAVPVSNAAAHNQHAPDHRNGSTPAAVAIREENRLSLH
jgi:hypothetical protein